MKVEKEKLWDIRKRSFAYAMRAIKLHQALQELGDRSGWIIGKQYLRSATSVGALIEEAQSGESRADFIHKYCIAQKEAKESLYWLRLLAGTSILPRIRLVPIMEETNELIAVITAIIVKTKKKLGSTKREVEV